MKVCWIISEDIPTKLIDPAVIKDTAESWGSWKTWQAYNPDNCICASLSETKTLIEHAFQYNCTLYIMQDSYAATGSPEGVKLFNGQFKNNSVSNKDDIIALNLAVQDSDIVLLAGFDFSPVLNTDEEARRESRLEYYFNVREIMKANFHTQFVLVDYQHQLASWVQELDNVTQDTIESVQNLLG